MDQITVVKNKYRLEQWTKRIQECQSSGMKIDDWCIANGLNRNTYYYWLRKVRKTACQDLSLVHGLPEEPAFKRLEVQPPVVGTQTAVIIHLPTATLEVQNGACQKTVEAVLLALKSSC